MLYAAATLFLLTLLNTAVGTTLVVLALRPTPRGGDGGPSASITAPPPLRPDPEPPVKPTVPTEPRRFAREIHRFPNAASHIFAVSPDGKRAVVPWGLEVKVLDLERGKPLPSIKFDERGVEDVAFMPDGKHCVVRRGDAIEFLDLESGKIAGTLANRKALTYMTVSADGHRCFLSGHPDRQIHQWDFVEGRELARSEEFGGGNRIAASADGRRLLVSNSGALLWDTAKGFKVRRLALPPGHGGDLCLNHDGTRALVIMKTRVYYWDVDKDREIGSFEPPRTPYFVAIAPNGQTALVTHHVPVNVNDPNKREKSFVWLYDLERFRLIHEFDKQEEQVERMIYLPDSTRACWSARDGILRVWELPTLAP